MRAVAKYLQVSCKLASCGLNDSSNLAQITALALNPTKSYVRLFICDLWGYDFPVHESYVLAPA